MRTVIIGAGAAGISAAAEVEKRKPWEEIIILARDKFPYSRCMLYQYLAGNRTEEQLKFVEDSFIHKRGINFQSDIDVKSIDVSEKKVLTNKGDIYFDRLLIATGACYSIPPIPNFRSASNVYGFRDLKDAKKIRKICKEGTKVVIVGSGLIGMDVAYALSQLGIDITVVEMAIRIMPLQTDMISASRYQTLFENAGVRFRLGTGVSDTSLDEAGNIKHVILSDGSSIPCDIVVVAAGIRPNVNMLGTTDILVNRGIQVNEYMRTSAEDIYAAGDVTGLSGIWSSAVEQGRVAGINIAGGAERYTDRFCIKNTMNFFGLPMISVGSVGTDGDDYTILTQETPKKYKKVILRDGKVIGALFLGDISGTGIWQYLIKNQIDISEVKKSIFDISIADFHCFDEEIRKKRVQNVLKLI